MNFTNVCACVQGEDRRLRQNEILDDFRNPARRIFKQGHQKRRSSGHPGNDAFDIKMVKHKDVNNGA